MSAEHDNDDETQSAMPAEILRDARKLARLLSAVLQAEDEHVLVACGEPEIGDICQALVRSSRED